MATNARVVQTFDKSGYIITCKKNFCADVESDIMKELNKRKGGKHVEIKLWIKDLLTLQKKKDEEYFCYCDIQINIVDIYGVVVTVKSNAYGVLYKVDDGTGEIDCWHDNQSKINPNKFSKLFESSEQSFEEDNINDSTMESSIFSPSSEVFSVTYNCEKETEVDQWLREQILRQTEMPLGLGNTVHLRGKLSDFRGERCIRIYNIRHVIDVNEETDRRLELIHLYQTVYTPKKNTPQT